LRVYLSVPIIANRDLARAKAMAKAITDAGLELSSPWVLEATRGERASTLDVFRRDKEGVESSDAIVADVSAPSTGVGMEVMAAHYRGKRIVVVALRGSLVSRMLTHLEPKEVVEFEGNEDLYLNLRRVLETRPRA